MLHKPYLAKCSDRSIKARVNPKGQNPDEWFSRQLLAEKGYFGLTFDFFIDWSKNTVTPVFWLKAIMNKGVSYEAISEVLSYEMNVLFTEITLKRQAKLSKKLDVKSEVVIFKDDLDWTDEESQIGLVDIEYILNDKEPEMMLISLARFKDKIKEYSGGAVKIGSKGLFYGTSSLECALSKTDSLYPGDIDLLLIDLNDEPIAVLEYKKHNLFTPIENQRLSNYYPRPDRRKYNRLALLRDFLGRNQSIPILNIYYPTREKIKNGKVELIIGGVDKLKTKARGYFSKTNCSSGRDSALFNVLAGISHFHKSNK